MSFTYAQLRAEYADLWRTMSVHASRKGIVDRIVDKSLANKGKYATVSQRTGVPWEFIAAAHSLESSQNFTRHLHNGDPLSARTELVPAGRPKSGRPPFTWEESAMDALTMPAHSLHLVKDWPIERVLYELERYNGWGYRTFHPNTLSPYLWSFTNHYSQGKYVADGRWSSQAVSTQCGAACILKGIYDRDGKAVEAKDEPFDEDTESLQEYLNALGASPKLVTDGIYGPKTRQAVKNFQIKANLQIDGIAGPKTWAAIRLRINPQGEDQ